VLYDFDSEGRGLFKSVDKANTWTNMTQPPTAYVISLAVDPKNSNIVFAGTDKGIFESKDGAKHATS
jgi:hypothetical protein